MLRFNIWLKSKTAQVRIVSVCVESIELEKHTKVIWERVRPLGVVLKYIKNKRKSFFKHLFCKNNSAYLIVESKLFTIVMNCFIIKMKKIFI